MKLNVLERLVLLAILPNTGTITTVRIVHDVQMALSFSEEEHKVLQFEKLTDGGTKWEEGVVEDKAIELGPRATAMIVDALARLDKEEKLSADHLSLWEKFMVSEVPVGANPD